MMWLTWRQFRAQAIAAAAGLAVVAVVLGVTGIGLISQYNADGLGTCHSSCTSQATRFLDIATKGSDTLLFNGGLVLLYLVPALIGIFWGAPLIAREFETGTHRLAWNQSISRTRWTLMKLGLIGLAAVATAGLLSLVITWWVSPIDSAMTFNQPGSGVAVLPRLGQVVFGARGVVPLGYAAFAFALGVTAGVLIRKTLPAMAITLAIFAAVAIMVPIFVRPHLLPPVQVTAPFNAYQNNGLMISSPGNQMTVVGDFSKPGAWVLSNETITQSGNVFTGPATSACQSGTANACSNWLNSLHLRQSVSYQPASQFWPLQFIETGIYLVLAAGLGCVCVWRVRRRRV